MNRAAFLFVVTAGGAALGCSSSAAGPAPSAERSPIASLHAEKCGACHVPPEPGTRSRAHVADAFTRHARRVHLTADQWRAMLDYLAPMPPMQGATTAQARPARE